MTLNPYQRGYSDRRDVGYPNAPRDLDRTERRQYDYGYATADEEIASARRAHRRAEERAMEEAEEMRAQEEWAQQRAYEAEQERAYGEWLGQEAETVGHSRWASAARTTPEAEDGEA